MYFIKHTQAYVEDVDCRRQCFFFNLTYPLLTQNLFLHPGPAAHINGNLLAELLSCISFVCTIYVRG